MNEEQLNNNSTTRVTIGRGNYYIQIGTVFLASMTSPTEEQCQNLSEQFGINVLTADQWQNLPAPEGETEVEQDGEN